MKRFSTLFFSPKEELRNTHMKTEVTTPIDKNSVENAPSQRIVAEVYFPRISFLGCPFIWYYYPHHDLAIWTGHLHDAPHDNYSLKALLTKLQTIPGVSIEDGEAVIRKAGDFCLQHQMKYLSYEEPNHVDFALKKI
ncbi:hypothetical protein Lsai_1809 [Legionella sainthelensi]|uniref:Uncharacterized protein n=1 Tax=Legionella sainthelensi TaxID=28087 RepID=A0A0W0YJZ5_9GAMM|nr:hypothetical protein [Legionella sainthelensi]KTD57205.1 hypothetical protein Lsai_1809 [Legionella sainthelensi]VEH37510.1 Uncharacterised protein [Legionella sainthelensi]